MQRSQETALELFTRVHAFLQRARPQGEAATIVAAVDSLGAVIDTLRNHQMTQALIERAQREQTVVRRRQAQRLQVGLMRPIARMARVLHPDDEALQQALFVPRSTRTEALVSAATSMAETLAPRLERFAEAGLAKDALDRLIEAAQELRTTATARSLEGARRVAATEAIRQTVQRGLTILRLLDALVQLPMEANVAQRAEWKSLMRRANSRKAVEAPLAPSGEAGERRAA